MNRNEIRLTESELTQIIKESVGRVLGEAKKKEDPMLQYLRDMEDAQKVRDYMHYIYNGGRKPEVKRFNKNSDKRVNEAYNRYNELQRLAYENQEIRPMIQKVAEFARDVAQIGKMQGNNNYYQFYSKLNGDILQMNNLWNFLDNVDY